MSRAALFFSSATDMWSTPQDLYDRQHTRFGFTLDVCASPENAKCARYFTKEQDGLAQVWDGVCWMNPPYGRGIGRWMEKAYRSAQQGATVVCLIPARTDTGWWHDYAMKGEVEFLRGRLKFGGHRNSAPFPSALVIFRNEEVESNMANLKGTLKVVKANDHGFYSVKIDDTWYGTGSKNEPSGVVTGDTVEGEFELEKGKYKTITKAGLRKAASEASAPQTKTSAGSAGGTDWAAKDASIRYQSSRKDALAFMGLPGVLVGIVGKAKAADQLGIIEATLDRYTAAFHEDVATFGAVTRANAVAVDPTAPASDEDDE